MSDKQWKDMTQAECDEVMKRLLEEPTYLGCGEEEEDQESERARWNARIELFGINLLLCFALDPTRFLVLKHDFSKLFIGLVCKINRLHYISTLIKIKQLPLY